MEVNTYRDTYSTNSPYIILVKQFDQANYCVPPANTKAYSYPKAGSSVVYTFPQPTSSTRYNIISLVFCSGNYWVKIPNLGTGLKDGYVKCGDINFDYTKYAAPDKQTSNKEIGENTDVIFNMWYFPVKNIKGVDYATPLYYQYYYDSYGNRINSLKCTLLSSISGDYKYVGINYDPTMYLDKMTNEYWSSDGLTSWIATMARTTSQDTIRQKAKSNLDAHKPFLVGAQNKYGTDHLVLVVGYKNNGACLADYIVLDSCETEFSTLANFFSSFPKYAGWTSISGKGYVYGEY